MIFPSSVLDTCKPEQARAADLPDAQISASMTKNNVFSYRPKRRKKSTYIRPDETKGIFASFIVYQKACRISSVDFCLNENLGKF